MVLIISMQLYHVSLGLVYLHGRNIVHGDLKSVGPASPVDLIYLTYIILLQLNVLIDDAENAVLCDFGLSRMKADVASRTVRQTPTMVTGSRNWMAPERFKGGSLKKPCDIYAFGMMVYEVSYLPCVWSRLMLLFGEVHTNEIPLGHIEYSDFIELVANQDIRPERPDGDEAPQLADDSWRLAELCWQRDPVSRPNIGIVCDTMSRLLDNNPRQQVMKVSALIPRMKYLHTMCSYSIYFVSLHPRVHRL